MHVSMLLTFAAAFFVFAASPGPDNMAIVARTISGGAKSGLAYGAGTVTGILTLLLLTASGLSLAAGELGTAMTVLRWAGAVFLVWTGVKLLKVRPVLPDGSTDARQGNLLAVYATGIALNLGNPKMALFHVALLPNIVGTSSLSAGQVGALVLVVLAVEIMVIGGHVALASRARRFLRNPATLCWVNRFAGLAMVGIGGAVVAV